MLARTNWDVPKHEGLTMFLVPMNAPGITLRRIKQVNGSIEFCEEFFDGLELGDDAVIGRGQRRLGRGLPDSLYHERRAVGGGSSSPAASARRQDRQADRLRRPAGAGRPGRQRAAAELAGRAPVHRAVQLQLIDHVFHGVNDGLLPRPPVRSSASRMPRTSTSNWTPPWRGSPAALASVDTGDDLFPSANAICRGRPFCWAAAPPRSAPLQRHPTVSLAG